MKLAAVAILTLLAAPIFAQAPEGPPPPADGMHGGPAGMHRGPGGPEAMRHSTVAAPITNAPLTAKYTSTSNFTTRDGKTISRDGSASIYRDSLGRTREDITLPPPPVHPQKDTTAATASTAASPSTPRTMTVIYDPVANTVTRLMPERKVAMVETVPPDFFKHAIDREAREAAGTQRPDREAAVTSLGSKTFAGVSATGTRVVRTFTPHNEDSVTTATPKTETHEAWFSPDLKLEVSSTEIGTHGTSTNTLTALTRAEPDATLFKVPEGYTIKPAPDRMHHGFRGPGGPDHGPADRPDGPPPAGL